jgi:hypothetical protein
VRHPVAQGLGVPLRVGPDPRGLGEDVLHPAGNPLEINLGQRLDSGERGFGGPDDRSLLVDPDAVRDVQHAKPLGQPVADVDQRRVLRPRGLDVRAAGRGALGVHPDGHHLQPSRMQLGAQLLPPGQMS